EDRHRGRCRAAGGAASASGDDRSGRPVRAWDSYPLRSATPEKKPGLEGAPGIVCWQNGFCMAYRTARFGVLALCLAAAAAALADDPALLIARAASAVVVLSDEESGQGSGFAVSSEGIIVTNLHVIADMKQPRVTL